MVCALVCGLVGPAGAFLLALPAAGAAPPPPDLRPLPPAHPFQLGLRARAITPPGGVDSATVTRGVPARGDVHYLVQFRKLPTAGTEARLAGDGISLGTYVGGNAYVASSTAADVDALATDASVRWVGPLAPRDKIDPALARGEVPRWARRPGGEAVLIVTLHPDVRPADVRPTLASLGRVASEEPTLPAIVLTAHLSDVERIAAVDGVQYVGVVDDALVPTNDVARQTAKTEQAWALDPMAPVRGAGVVGLVEDVGIVDTTHPDFLAGGPPGAPNRIVDTEPPPPNGAPKHATHVAGIFAGDGTASAPHGGAALQWSGHAPRASIRSFAITGEIEEQNADITADFTKAMGSAVGPRPGVDLATMSLGQPSPATCDRGGLYTSSAVQMDGFVRGAIPGSDGRPQPLILTVAAGNWRSIFNPPPGLPGTFAIPTCGDYGSLSTVAAAKNPVIVGAVNSDTATVTSSSSWGPTQDGRLKPDLVAPGCNTKWLDAPPKQITSTAVGGGYTEMCGTSMATPLVAAVNALVIEEWRKAHPSTRPSPSTAKAILIHTAAPASVPASLTTGLPGANDGITLVDPRGGSAGVDLGVIYRDPGAPNAPFSATVTPDAKSLIVDLATNGAGAVTTTANDIVAAVNAQARAGTQRSFQAHLAFGGDPAKPWGGNTGAGVVAALPAANLSGGGVVSGPDFRSGWGMVDALEAVKLVADDARNPRIHVGAAATTELDRWSFSSDGTTDPKVTLVWDDPPGAALARPALVNDLDLRLVDPAGTVYRPLVQDPTKPMAPAIQGNDRINNVEQVRATRRTGVWQVRVFGTSVPQGPQEYSLVMPPSNVVDVADADAMEGGSGEARSLDFQLRLSPPNPDGPVSVDYETLDGTATVASGDYQRTFGTITFPPNTSGPLTMSVPVVGDADPEGPETVRLDLSSPRGGVLAHAQAIGVIADDDAPLPYDVIATTGQRFTYPGPAGTPVTAAISGLGNGPSIAGSGNVGFSATFPGGSGVFIGTGKRDIRLLSPGTVSPARRFGTQVQINDHDVVGAQDQLPGAPLSTKWRAWDGSGTTTDHALTIASGGVADPGRTRAEFADVSSSGSISNTITPAQVGATLPPDISHAAAVVGSISALGQGGTSGVLAVPKARVLAPVPNPFWQMPIDGASAPRPQVADDGRTVVRFRAASWAPQQRYLVGAEIVPTVAARVAAPFVFRATSTTGGGTSGASEPAWPAAAGAMATDRDTVWVNTGQQAPPGDTIRLFGQSTTTGSDALRYTDVAGPADGFAPAPRGGPPPLGRAPGLSDDGQAIAFFGVNDGTRALTKGPGIFIAIEKADGTRILKRIAGVAGNRVLDPGETFLDTNGNGNVDSATEVDRGPFAAFDDLSRVGVSSFDAKARAFNVVFIACGSVPIGATTCATTTHKAIYRIRVRLTGRPDAPFDRRNPSDVQADPASVVIQTGDHVEDFDPAAPAGGDRIADLSIHDPINGHDHGDVTFWARDAAGTEGIVRARSPEPLPVVFVPGVAGSVLVEAKSNEDPGDDEEIWPGFAIRGGRPDYDKLRIGRPGADVRVKDVLRAAGPMGSAATVPFKGADVYGGFLTALEKAGYRPYDTGLYSGNVRFCDVVAQRPKRPNLFVFPYDWRQDISTNAARLATYIGCVRAFYPNQKVDIVAHSMGGLLTRRYIMENPAAAATVNAVTTVNSPWLGAPKMPYILETGNFLTLPAYLGGMNGDDLRGAVASMPSAAQLGPSKAYYDLGATPPVGEEGRDWDTNGLATEVYDYPHQLKWLNARNTAHTPGKVLDAFHQLPVNGLLQDDWSGDPPGIAYFHLYGIQAREATIGSIRATTDAACKAASAPVTCSRAEGINVRFTVGDGTVPALSAARRTTSADLNAPSAELIPFASPGPPADAAYEHGGMMANPAVQNTIVGILGERDDAARIGSRAVGAPSGTASVAPALGGVRAAAVDEPEPRPEEARYVSVANATDLAVRDEAGDSTSPDPTSLLAGTVPGVSVTFASASSALAILPTKGRFTTTFTMTDRPLLIEVRRGTGERTVSAQRYLDVDVAAGVTGRLVSSSTGTAPLELDIDGDGTFETTVDPTVAVTGDDAADITPPVVTLVRDPLGGHQVELEATDAGTGVRQVRYSLDGTTFGAYSGPFTADPASVARVVVIADDDVGNRAVETFPLRPPGPPPVAEDGAARTPEDVAVAVPLSATGEAGAPLNFALARQPAHGAVTGIGGGVATYLPAPDFHGTDTFTFTASDGVGTSSSATVTMTVDPVNDAPVATGTWIETAQDGPGTPLDLGDLVSDVETADAGLSIQVVTPPARGSLSGTGASLTYTHTPGATGADSFSYTATDRGDPDGCSDPTPACTAPATSPVATVAVRIVPVVSVGDASVVEADSGAVTATVPVSLSTPSDLDTRVSWATADDTAVADADYDAASGELVIPAGTTTGAISVAVRGDDQMEPEERLFVDISAPVNGAIGRARGIVAITDDDTAVPPTCPAGAQPTLEIDDASVTESTPEQPASLTLKARLNCVAAAPVSVRITAGSGSATAGRDFAAMTRTLTFAPGVTTATATLVVLGDNLAEGDETVTIALSDASGLTLARPAATVTIVDDEPASRLLVVPGPVREGSLQPITARATVTVDPPLLAASDVTWSLEGGSAEPGVDFRPDGGTVRLRAGQREVAIPITILPDDLAEGDETLTLDVAVAAVGEVRPLKETAAPITISDDDGPLSRPCARSTIAWRADAASAQWAEPANWSPARLPGRDDVVCIDAAPTDLVLVTGSVEVGELESRAPLTIGGRLAIVNPLGTSVIGTATGASKLNPGGALVVDGLLHIAGPLDWTAVPSGSAPAVSTIAGAGLVVIDPGARVTAVGGSCVSRQAGSGLGSAQQGCLNLDVAYLESHGTIDLVSGTITKDRGGGVASDGTLRLRSGAPSPPVPAPGNDLAIGLPGIATAAGGSERSGAVYAPAYAFLSTGAIVTDAGPGLRRIEAADVRIDGTVAIGGGTGGDTQHEAGLLVVGRTRAAVGAAVVADVFGTLEFRGMAGELVAGFSLEGSGTLVATGHLRATTATDVPAVRIGGTLEAPQPMRAAAVEFRPIMRGFEAAFVGGSLTVTGDLVAAPGARIRGGGTLTVAARATASAQNLGFAGDSRLVNDGDLEIRSAQNGGAGTLVNNGTLRLVADEIGQAPHLGAPGDGFRLINGTTGTIETGVRVAGVGVADASIHGVTDLRGRVRILDGQLQLGAAPAAVWAADVTAPAGARLWASAANDRDRPLRLAPGFAFSGGGALQLGGVVRVEVLLDLPRIELTSATATFTQPATAADLSILGGDILGGDVRATRKAVVTTASVLEGARLFVGDDATALFQFLTIGGGSQVVNAGALSVRTVQGTGTLTNDGTLTLVAGGGPPRVGQTEGFRLVNSDAGTIAMGEGVANATITGLADLRGRVKVGQADLSLTAPAGALWRAAIEAGPTGVLRIGGPVENPLRLVDGFSLTGGARMVVTGALEADVALTLPPKLELQSGQVALAQPASVESLISQGGTLASGELTVTSSFSSTSTTLGPDTRLTLASGASGDSQGLRLQGGAQVVNDGTLNVSAANFGRGTVVNNGTLALRGTSTSTPSLGGGNDDLRLVNAVGATIQSVDAPARVGALDNFGTIVIGRAGPLSANSFTQGLVATLQVETSAASPPSTATPPLAVLRNAALDGALAYTIPAGETLPSGTRVVLVRYGSRTSTFAAVTGQPLATPEDGTQALTIVIT